MALGAMLGAIEAYSIDKSKGGVKRFVYTRG